MKKILLAISFVFACVVITNAQTQSATDTKPAKQAGDVAEGSATVTPAPVAVPQSVSKDDVKDVTKKEDKKACSKQKSCCKKGDDKAKASCDKKKEEAKAEPATEEIKKTEEK